jgi:GNAT superfamily N-acetyltransferase
MSMATSESLDPVADRLIIRPASPDDEKVIIGLVEEASWWLRGKNTDQWSTPWPDRRRRDERIREGIAEGHTWIVWDRGRPAATVTLSPRPDVDIWGSLPRVPALYLHRLVVSRAYAGVNLGGVLIDWAAQRELRRREVRWVRVDVWRTNTALHAYYERRGFSRCGTYEDLAYPAGALFRKDVRHSLRTSTSLLTEEVPVAESRRRHRGAASRRRVTAGPPLACT